MKTLYERLEQDVVDKITNYEHTTIRNAIEDALTSNHYWLDLRLEDAYNLWFFILEKGLFNYGEFTKLFKTIES